MPHEHCAEFTKTTKIKFKIGEFSKLNRVTVKTLRHYEEIGLLVPSQVDKWTGYRYYDVCQLGRMNTIRDLKELGFTLEEIGELFDEGRTRPSPELIAAKTAECRETLLRLLAAAWAACTKRQPLFPKGDKKGPPAFAGGPFVPRTVQGAREREGYLFFEKRYPSLAPSQRKFPLQAGSSKSCNACRLHCP